MKRASRWIALLAAVAGVWTLTSATALAAAGPATTTAATTSAAHFLVDGVMYTAQPGQEIVIPLQIAAPATSDPRTVPVAVHLVAVVPSTTRSPAANATILAYSANCWSSNGAKAWFTNAYGTTLGSYELDVSFSADTGNNVVTGYSRTTDHWYANTGLFWYYNSRLDQNTNIDRQAATAVSTIHFTGPAFQTENVEVAVDMHGDCSSDYRWYVFSGDAQIK